MTSRLVSVVCLAAGIVCGVVAPAGAQEAVAVSVAPAISPEARALLGATRAAYAKLTSYQDKATLKFQLRSKDDVGNDHNEDDAEVLDYTYAGARRYAFTHRQFAVHSDGVTRTAYLKDLKQYLVEPAGDGIGEEARYGPIAVLTAVHVPAAMLMEPGRFEERFPLMSEATGVKAEERAGEAGKRVSGKGKLPEMAADELIPMTMWISDATGLIREVTIDLKPLYTRVMGAERTIERAAGTITFDSIVVDGTPAPERFGFTPGEGDARVTRFMEQTDWETVRALVGHPAPALEGRDTTGKAVTLEDFKGRVLVMVFWTINSAEALSALPIFEELSRELPAASVAVLGVNVDDESHLGTIQSEIKNAKTSFRQMLDAQQKTVQDYVLVDVPSVIVIDGEGNVAHAQVGVSPRLKGDIRSVVMGLLKPVVPKAEGPGK